MSVLFLDGFSSLLSSFSEWDEVGQTEAQRRDAGAPRCVAQREAELMSVRGSLRTGRPFGASERTEETAKRLNIELVPRPRRRRRKQNELPPFLIPGCRGHH